MTRDIEIGTHEVVRQAKKYTYEHSPLLVQNSSDSKYFSVLAAPVRQFFPPCSSCIPHLSMKKSLEKVPLIEALCGRL